MEKRRILFVDDESAVLKALETMLEPMRELWSMEFVSDPRRALEQLARGAFDVVVSDTSMPVMDGSEFLAEVMLRHPQVVRIILARQTDRDRTLDALHVSHQFLAKPCDASTLRATVSRALALRKFLDGDTPLKALVSRLDSLPSMPALYRELVDALQDVDINFSDIARIIEQDPAMAAKILQLVNSAYFSLSRHVSDLDTALMLLGLDTIKSLVLSVQVFSQFEEETLRTLSVERLWRHSVRTGALARALAQAEKAPREMINDAFTAGLLHDTGKLILAANMPNIYAKVVHLCAEENLAPCEAERQLFGAAHAETGAYLLGLWGLPETIVEAVAYHHHPQDRETLDRSALTFVHVANALSQLPDAPAAILDTGYLGELELLDRLPAWAELSESVLA